MKVRDFEFGFLSKAEVPRAKPKGTSIHKVLKEVTLSFQNFVG
jgi:hypothetical protein